MRRCDRTPRRGWTRTSSSRSRREIRTPCWISAARSAIFLSDASDDLDLRDLAYSAGARRGHLEHRLAIVVAGRDEAVGASAPSCAASRMSPS